MNSNISSLIVFLILSFDIAVEELTDGRVFRSDPCFSLHLF